VRLQHGFVWIVIFVLSTQAVAQDAGTVMVYGDEVSVNNSEIPKSTILFPGDVLTTRTKIANLVDTNSLAEVQPDSIIDYQTKSLKLDHGEVRVSTSVGMSVRVSCIEVLPAEEVMTKFDVLDVNGKIQINARQGDLIISEGHRKERLAQGQQGTRNDADKCRAGAGAEPAATGGILDSKVAMIAGSAIVGGVLIWLLVDESGTPLSNYQP
jgi:hypothetical protein